MSAHNIITNESRAEELLLSADETIEALRARFLQRAATANQNGCREWRGHIGKNGYGKWRVGGVHVYAHRLAWLLFRGPIPVGHEIDHTCFNRKCVTLEHLEPVTPAENKRRALEAGRTGGIKRRAVGETWSGSTKVATARQLEVLSFIGSRVAQVGVAPTIREICSALSIRSSNGANDHLKALERKGLIRRSEMKARAVEITTRGMRALGLHVNQHRCLSCGQSVPAEVSP